MVLDFSWLPPEINSARIFAGAGSGPLFLAASAWDGLATDLAGSAASFDSVITGLASGSWTGPTSLAMAAAASPYVQWLSAAAAQAVMAANQARAAATAFESALSATVHPAAVTSNRTSLAVLVATNILGQNTPAIFENEFQYVEMWAQDVAAMLGYHIGATSVASTLTPFNVPPTSLAGLGDWASQLGTVISAAESSLVSGAQSLGTNLMSGVASLGSTIASAAPGLVTGVQSAVSAVPISSLTQVAQIAMYPASMAMSPMMSLLQMGMQGANGTAGAAGLVGATAGELGADGPKMVGDMKPLGGIGGGLGGLGGGMSADLGKARLVGAMSVPPTWQGSMPARMVSSAMAGMGAAAPAAAMAGPTGTGGMPMMPMPMGMGGAGAGMPGGMMGRGGASPHVVQNRPSVVPRTGVG